MIDLQPEDLSAVRAVLAEHVPECEVWAYGSRVRGTSWKYSDLDLAIIGPARLDPVRIYRLRDAFEESDLDFRVDVLDWSAVSESFRRQMSECHDVIQSAVTGADIRQTQRPERPGAPRPDNSALLSV
jgi:type I restriction enzyme S subunit